MMQQVAVLVTEDGVRVEALAPKTLSLIEEREAIEQYRKAGWLKVLSEYIPQAHTSVTILTREKENNENRVYSQDKADR